MDSLRMFAVLAAGGYLCVVGTASADVVVDWNLIASNTLYGPPSLRPGPTALLDLAVVHVAMHDAIQAYEKRYRSYDEPIPYAAGSPDAAAAAAAYYVLIGRFPPLTGSLTTQFQAYLATHSLVGDPGIAVGQFAAGRILALRAGDGSFPSNPPPFMGGTRAGEWRPTLPAFASMVAPWLGSVTPFTLKDASQLLASPPPPHLRSGLYARDYNEVKRLGSSNSTARTPQQTALALFYADNIPEMWQRILRALAATSMKPGDTARMFALANMAAADALISSWYTKSYYNFWRPITAIREGNDDGNPDTAGDPAWTPLLPTPAYPEYASGANAVTAAVARVLQRLIGDKTTFSVTSKTAPQTITYERLSDMMQDLVDVRIYQGIHFRSADDVGRRQGIRVADWALSHCLRPSE